MNPIKGLVNATLSKLRRSPRTSRLLERFGIDPMRYWLLKDLFAEISERGEMMDQLGRNGVALETAATIYFGLSALLTLMLVLAHPSQAAYLTTFLVFTGFLLTAVLLSETGNSLVNPTEGLILAHQPINGATYTAAKLSHLARIVLYLVPGLNIVPAAGGLFLTTSAWYYPVLHLAAAFAVGLVAALLCCALFGWLMRLVPIRRLKAAGQLAGALPFLALTLMGPIQRFFSRLKILDRLPERPATRWSLGIVTGIAVAGVVVFGLRSLSADYLIRVSGLMHGGASAGSSTRNSRIGAIVSRFFGGQAGRAGFMYVSRMILRDWQFRRQLLPIFIPVLLGVGGVVKGGWPADPFSSQFAPIHLLPHMLGSLLLFACFALPYGNDYKGAWIFLLFPSRSFDGFASGIFAFFWIEVIAIPLVIVFPLFAWHWGISHAALFIAFSLAAASIYLALELRLVDDVPFSRQMDTSRGAGQLPILIGAGIAISIAVGLQHYLIFRSPTAVALTTATLGAAAYFAARASVRAMAASFRYRLGMTSAEAGTLYKEIEA